MSFRNDHDATLARVDALQLEVTRLAAENESLRISSPVASSKPSRTLGVIALAAGVLAIGGAVTFGIAASADHGHGKAPAPSAAPATDIAAVETGPAMSNVELRACALSIKRRPIVDIHIPDLDAVDRTAAPCREHLRDAVKAMPAGDRRDQIEAWADAEDKLANRISLIHEYYTTAVASREGFATAPQLWNEYGNLLVTRNATLSFVLAPDNS